MEKEDGAGEWVAEGLEFSGGRWMHACGGAQMMVISDF
jgi:hypothetical protein